MDRSSALSPGRIEGLFLVPFLDLLDVGAAVFDADGTLRYLNAMGERLVGRRAGDVVGTVAPVLAGVADRVWQPGGPRTVAVAVADADSGERLIENMVREMGSHVVVLFRDVTAAHQRAHTGAVAATFEDLARAQTARDVVHGATRAIHTAVGIARVDIALLGPDALSVLDAEGASPERDRIALSSQHPLVDAVRRGVELWLGAEDLAVERYPELAQGGAERWRVYLPLRGDRGIVGSIGIALGTASAPGSGERDALRAVARHVALAIERASVVASLRDALRITDEVIGILGHDLRNPVHAIILTIETLLADHENEPLARFLVRMRNSAERMARLIDQLLDLAKARLGGGVDLDLVATDLGALVQQHVDEAQPGAVQVIELEVRGDTRGVWDPDRLSQVLANLLGNAVAHGSQDAPIQIEVDGSGPDEVLVSVWNGGAIPDEILPVVFEPFRGRRDGRRPGLGLGLTIAQQMARAHGGGIAVRSSPLDGTTFVVSLPRSARAATASGETSRT